MNSSDKIGHKPKRRKPLEERDQWPPRVTFDFANATPAQKTIFEEENRHVRKRYRASFNAWRKNDVK